MSLVARGCHLRNFAGRINSPLASYDKPPPARFLFVDVRARVAGGTAYLRRIHHLGRRALDVSVGKIQGLPARSLVGELCTRGAAAHRATARRTWAGREVYLARLQTGLRGSCQTGAPGPD